MKNVFLVRHGQASAGTDNYDRLSTLGIKQAELLGEYWAKSGFDIQAAFSGSLERQQDTAKYALAGLSNRPAVNTIEALNEYDHTLIDRLYGKGITSDSGMNLRFDQYVEIMENWRDAKLQPATSDTQSTESDSAASVESWDTFSQRGWLGIQDAVASSEAASMVFFTSGGIVATVLKQVMGLDFGPTMHALWHTRNSSVTHLRIDDTDPTGNNTCVVDYNTITHLLLHHDKGLITQI